MDSLDKLKAQTDLALAEVKALLAYYWLKGGPGSGNWGHAGRPGDKGGSAPKKGATARSIAEGRGVGMSVTTGRDADRRQQEAKNKAGFFKGNLKTASIQDIYDGSSDEVKALADETGVIATDPATMAYVKNARSFLASNNDKTAAKNIDKAQYEQSVDIATKSSYAARSMSDFSPTMVAPSGMYKGWPTPKIEIGQSTALNHLGSAINPTNRKDLKEDHFAVVPTEKELKVFQKIADSSSVNGHLLLNAGKKFEKLTPAELETLNGYGRRALSLNIAQSGMRHAASILDPYSAAATTKKGMQEISREALANPVKPGEDFGDYAKRLSSSLGKQTSGKNYNPKQMSAFYTVSGGERADIEKRIADTHDTKTHWGTRTKVHNVFAVKDSPENEAKFQAAVEKSAKRLAAAGSTFSPTTSLFHGTSTFGGGRIAANGFIVPPAGAPGNAGRMLDAGVYLAHQSSKSALYLGTGVSHSVGRRGMLILTEAAMGVQGQWDKIPNWRSQFKSGKIDTVFAPKGTRNPEWPPGYKPLYNHEWSVRNPDAVRVRYLIDAETVNP